MRHNFLDSTADYTDAYKKALRLLEEQTIIEENKRTPNIKLKEPKDISSGSMQNPVDEDATYRKKCFHTQTA